MLLVNNCCCGGSGYCGINCSPCRLPAQDLTLAWTNPVLGPGSVTLKYNGPASWISECTNQHIYVLSCPGSIQFNVTYYLSGACPTGEYQMCTSPGAEPFGITLTSYNCGDAHTDLSLVYTLTSSGCPGLWSYGYTSFTITGPADTSSTLPCNCGPLCPACGGVKLLPGTFTDANGTSSMTAIKPNLESWQVVNTYYSPILSATGPILPCGNVCPNISTGTYYYAWAFRCNFDGTITISSAFSSAIDCWHGPG